MAIALPLEIWHEIAHHLPAGRVEQLYAVNRAFFEISMKAKYHIALFRRPADIKKNLKYLSSPMALKHVRILHVWPHIMSTLLVKKSGRNILVKMLRKSHDEKKTEKPVSMDQMLQVIDGLSRVVTFLGIHSNDFDDADVPDLTFKSMPIVAACTSFRNLRSLILDVMLEGCRMALAQTTVFPNLETLCILFSSAYHTTDTRAIICDHLAPFVNNHHPSLRDLYLSSYLSNYTFDVPSFLLKLRHLPYLKTFGLMQKFVNVHYSDSAGMNRLLELHAKQLRKLSLLIKEPTRYSAYPTDDEWYGQKFLQVQFPKLEALDLSMELYPDIVRTARYLRRFEDTLTSLWLLGKILSYHEVENVVTVFAQRGRLKTLHLCVQMICPELLSLLAAKLPSLESLRLYFYDIQPVTSNRRDTSLPGNYSNLRWNLRHFTAQPANEGFKDLTNCELIIRTAIPGLQTFTILQKGPKNYVSYTGI